MVTRALSSIENLKTILALNPGIIGNKGRSIIRQYST
jgi:hypothetical protein